jgi:hypothetical protein
MERTAGSSGDGQLARRQYRRDGRPSSSAGLTARNAQASADALRRVQKAKAAAKVKRYAHHKSKMRLLGEHERKSAATSAPIVASELPRPGAVFEADLNANGANTGKIQAEAVVNPDVVQGQVSRKRKRERDSTSVENCADTSNHLGRIFPAIAASASAASASPDTAFEGTSTLSAGEVKVDGEKSSDHEQQGKSWRKKAKYQPFKKELAIAAARRVERVRRRSGGFVELCAQDCRHLISLEQAPQLAVYLLL